MWNMIEDIIALVGAETGIWMLLVGLPWVFIGINVWTIISAIAISILYYCEIRRIIRHTQEYILDLVTIAIDECLRECDEEDEG